MAVRELSAGDVILRVDELLEVTYRSGDLGNLEDPLAETVFILLSRQTQGPMFKATFTALREQYPTWVAVLDAPREDLERLLAPSGLYVQRARQLQELLQAVREDNERRGIGPAADNPGDLTLDYLRDMSDEDAHQFLLALPGIGEKSARCIMSYALGRRLFAVDTHIRRVLARLKLVDAGNGKVKHEPYDALVPPSISTRLHVNLIHHGREVCRSENPKCGACVLVSFCPRGRQLLAERDDRRPAVVDLCAGVGGLSQGFIEAGYRPVAGVEDDRDAAQTYRANHPGVPVLEADVTELTAEELVTFAPAAAQPFAIISGTPCQGYSAAGARDPRDPRNTMYRHVIRLAHGLGARSAVLENVPGLKRVNGVGFLDKILRALQEAFGWAERHLLTASDFGVPQNRKRYVFIAAYPEDLVAGTAQKGPVPTHRPAVLIGEPPARLWDVQDLPTTRTLREVLEDLPAYEAGVDAEWVLYQGRVVLNASTMKHGSSVVEKISKIKPGEGPISYRRLTEDVARTLVAGHRALPVHPWLNRTISVREAARIQGFKDTHVFCGPRANQPLQAANAVPPPLAKAVARYHWDLMTEQALQIREEL